MNRSSLEGSQVRPLAISSFVAISILLLAILFPLSVAQFRPSAQKIFPELQTLCAKPAAKIDLVLPPIDFVPTYSANALIGSKFKFEVAFDNTQGNGTGYGPYIDVIFPASGIDGATVGQPYDGISFNQVLGASYLGSPVTASVYTFIPVSSTTPLLGSVVHPFTGQTMTSATGDQLVVIELPFGSYTPLQPPAGIIVNALVSPLADIYDPLTIQVQAGFRYSCSATGNGGSLVSTPAPGDHGSVTPVLFTIDKTYDGPEIGPKMGETATGPNFPRHYKITVDIADGQSITNLKVSDLLPDNLAYNASLQVNGPPWTQILPPPPLGVAASGSILAVNFPNVTGTPSLADVTVQFEFFIPGKDASGAWILDPTTGASAISENTATVEGNWTPLDSRDISGPVLSDPSVYTLVCKSIALQKRGINTTKGNVDVAATLPPTDNAPGDTILYRLDFQVSDYFTFDQLQVEDTISDGQFFWALPPVTYFSQYTVTDQLHTVSAAFNSSNTTTVVIFPCSGFPADRTDADFTLTGSLTGGWALSTPSLSPAQGKMNFYARIQEDYLCPVPTGDVSVDQNDKLFNRATIKGTILNNSTLQPIGPMQDDGGVDFKLVFGVLSKSIYAHTDRSGVQTLSPPATKLFAPGDKITFRLRYKLPHGDIENFSIEDFLPLPVLKAAQLATISLASCGLGPGIPAAGTACFVPGTLSVSGSGITKPPVNTLNFGYGVFDDPSSPLNGKLIDILFTLEIQNDPFVDGLFLTNQLLSRENNSFKEETDEITTAQFHVAEPNLRIRKGVVKTNNGAGIFSPPLTSPFAVPITSTDLGNPNLINSNLSNVDAGDLVTFAVVVENLGSSPYGAYDVRISDTLPANFLLPSSLTVTDGWGVPIFFTGSTASFFTAAGIGLNDPLPFSVGSLAPFDLTSGKNIAVITYTLQVAPQVTPCQTLANTATIENYSSTKPGPNYAASGYGGPYSDKANMVIKGAPGPLCPCVAFASGTTASLGMVDWWPFDETVGPIANDIRSFNNLGTYGPGSSAPTPTSGVVSKALCFDGVNDYVEVANQPEVNFNGICTFTAESFTIDAWVKTSANSGLQVILDKRSGPSNPIGYHLFLFGGRVGLQLNGLNFIEPPSGPNVADGNWHFIAVTVVRCTGAIGKLYVDGSQVHTFTPPVGSLVNTRSLQIGRRDPIFGNSYLRGCLDELEIFKRALSQTELQGIYAAGPSGKCK